MAPVAKNTSFPFPFHFSSSKSQSRMEAKIFSAKRRKEPFLFYESQMFLTREKILPGLQIVSGGPGELTSPRPASARARPQLTQSCHLPALSRSLFLPPAPLKLLARLRSFPLKNS